MTISFWPKKNIALSAISLLSILQLNATIRYVKPGGAGTRTGVSWATASGDLNAMLLASASGDEVWVASGTYFPTADVYGITSPINPRNKTFFIPDGVKLYGGFDGTELQIQQRNPALNITTLNGNIGLSTTDTDNSYNVVLAICNTNNSGGVTLDGFSIINGNANDGSVYTYNGQSILPFAGGGAMIYNGNNFLANNNFSNNKCTFSGGAVFIASGGSSQISFCTFTSCNATQGGAISFQTGTLQLLNNNFTGNNTTGNGGAVYVSGATALVSIKNTFNNNIATGYGGGAFLRNIQTMSDLQSAFQNNSARDGGAIYAETSLSLSADQTRVSGNTGNSGGGIYLDNVSAAFKKIQANGNTGSNSGGAIYATNGTFTIDSSILNSNQSGTGGAIFTSGCTATHSSFNGNTAQFQGGAIYSQGSSILQYDTIASNTLTSNIGINGGGGIYLEAGNSLVTNNIIKNNSAQYLAGAGIAATGGSATIRYNFIYGNSASVLGGGILVNNATCEISNNLIAGNSCNLSGGGIAVFNGSITSSGNTIAGNTAIVDGGGLYFSGTASTVSNCIFWDNKLNGSSTAPGSDFYLSSLSVDKLTFKHCLLQLNATNYTNTGSGNYDLGTGSTGNIFNQNPAFINPASVSGLDGILGTADDGYSLMGNSGAINTGNNSLIQPGIATDLSGTARIQGVSTDMGAYEFQLCNSVYFRFYVNSTTPTPSTNYSIGRSWALAFPSLSDALDAASKCSYITEIWVAGGTYKPATAYPGISNPAQPRDKTFFIPQGVKVYGGFAGTESLLSQRNIITNETILSGDIGTAGNASDNCHHVVVASSSNATIDGFTIRDGNANGAGTYFFGVNNIPRNSGAGVVYAGGTNTLNNAIITANTATDAGGGIYLLNSNNTISNSFIIENSSGINGGGLRSQSCNNIIVNNLFVKNASSGGGAIFLFGDNSSLSNNTLAENNTSNNGAGIFTLDGYNLINNNIFWNNKKSGNANVQGADYYRSSFDNNNNVFKNNLLQLSSSNYSTSGSGTFDLSNTAAGNIFALNPQFAQAANPPGTDGLYRTADDGFRLEACSPIINTGNNTLIPPGITSDIANALRILLGTVDMGPYEAVSATPNQSAVIAVSNLSIIKTQTSVTAYTNDCNTLIAVVSSSGGSPISGNTTARVWIEGTPLSGFVKRHYEITPASNAGSATGRVTLYFTQQDFTDFNTGNVIKLPIDATDAANNKANLRIEKRSGTSNDGSGLPPSYTGSITTIDPADADIIWNNDRNRWEVSIDVTGFSGFFAKTTSGILPLKWISITGTINTRKQAVIAWIAEEQNVLHYSVEKSTDGIHYFTIGNIAGKGDGTNSYTYTDTNPLSSHSYFRIQQTDADGKISYSSIVVLQVNGIDLLSAYPNPVRNFVSITSSKKQTAALFDATGRKILLIELQQGTVNMSTGKWSSGLYLLKTESGETVKLIKE